MAKAVGSIEIDIELCKGCDLCVQVCPVDVLEMATDLNRLGFRYPILLDGCTGCEMCALICPDFCITEVYRNVPGAARA